MLTVFTLVISIGCYSKMIFNFDKRLGETIENSKNLRLLEFFFYCLKELWDPVPLPYFA